MNMLLSFWKNIIQTDENKFELEQFNKFNKSKRNNKFEKKKIKRLKNYLLAIKFGWRS